MLRRAVLVLAVLLAACGPRVRGGRVSFDVPGGPYRVTCSGIRVDGRLLKAVCRTRDGGWRNTSIDVRACDQDIVNDDGRLRCGGGWSSRIPGGSYARSCSEIRVRDGVLRAECRARDGSWRQTSISVRACGRFRNNDGRLVCE